MGSLSADVDPKLTDLALIMDGGPNFLARMTALTDGKKANEQSLADLNLGLDIKRGLDEVQARLEAAAATLAQAQVRAQSIEAVAQATADALISSARDRLAMAEADGRVYLVNAQEHVDDLLRDAQLKHDEAITLHNQAVERELESIRLRDELQRQIDEHRQATETVDHLRTDLVARRNVLIEAIRRTGGVV